MQGSRVAWMAASLALGACGRSIEVRTMAAPEPGFAALHTFRLGTPGIHSIPAGVIACLRLRRSLSAPRAVWSST
jgi:hypothetical protein